jgi:hypothetical protein
MFQYLKRLGASLEWSGINGQNSMACLTWLVSTAISLEYEDRGDKQCYHHRLSTI